MTKGQETESKRMTKGWQNIAKDKFDDNPNQIGVEQYEIVDKKGQTSIESAAFKASSTKQHTKGANKSVCIILC